MSSEPGRPASPMGARRLRVLRTLLTVVAAAAAAIVLWSLPGAIQFMLDAEPGFWAMTIAALLVDIPLFGALRGHDYRVRSTLSVCFTFAIFVLWGVAPAVVVQAVASTVTVVGQRYQLRPGMYFVSRLICATFVADLVVDLAADRPLIRPATGLDGGDLLAFVALAAVWLTVSYGLLIAARGAARAGGIPQAASEVRYDLLSTSAAVLVVSPLLTTTIASFWKFLIVLPLMIWNRLAREQLRQQAQLGREPMSGLLNRQGLDVGIRNITDMDVIDTGRPRPFGVVVVTSDSLLTINRTLGRNMYERVVSVISQKMIDAYGADRVARISGEAIVIVMPDLDEDDKAIEQAEMAAAVIGARIEVDDVPFTLDPAAGVSLSPRHGRELGTLLLKADLAAADAQRQGRRAVLYVRASAELTERRLGMLRELHSVLRDPARHSEIAVLYQPQIDLDSGRLAGLEALVRWSHPTWGPIPTDELIEAIEPTEVIHLLTRHMLESVAAQVRRWNDEGARVRVAVNVSVQDLHEPDFVDELGATLRRHGIDASQLTIEITERMLISDAERVAMVANTLSELGVGLSLDDFGTGYASLQQLRLLPLTEVKIDRSYIRGLADDPADLAIVTSVHELADTLRVSVVAEGVEDQRTARALARLPGTVGQGYYFGRPMSPDDLRDWRYTPEPPPRRRPARRRLSPWRRSRHEQR